MSYNDETETKQDDQNCPYEDIIGIRSNNGYSPEYLVKLKNQPYYKSIWVTPADLLNYPSSTTLYNKASRNSSQYPSSPPYYDPQYDEIDKIVEKTENGYFVKWMGLDYTQCTLESKVDSSVLHLFRKKQKEQFPTPHGNVMSEPSADFEPQTRYSIGKLLLGYHQLACLNVLIANYLDQKNSDIVNQLNMNLHISVASFLQYSFEMCAEPGPYLIVAHSQFVHLWYTAVHQIEKMTAIEYIGSTESRKIIQEHDFIDKDNLKFHILVTSIDCLIEDIEKLSDIKWKVLIFSDSQKLSSPFSRYQKIVQRLVYSHLISYTSATSIQIIPALQRVNDFFLTHNEHIKYKNIVNSAGDLKAQITTKLQKRTTNGLIDIDNDIKTIYIDCPLNPIQKTLVKKVILSKLEQLENHNCMSTCQLFWRICNHPFIIYKQEFNMNGQFNFIECSTKLQVIAKIIENSIANGEKVIFVSHFCLMLDLIEDLANENGVSFSRIVHHSNHFDNANAPIFLYNPDFCDISTKAVEIASIAVIVDYKKSDFISILKGIKSNRISTIISLECAACAENKLAEICTFKPGSLAQISISNKRENEQIAEKLCKLVALNSFSNDNDINIDDLINSARSVPFNIKEHEMIIDDLNQDEFWPILIKSINIPEEFSATPIDEDEDYLTHAWTERERDQLFRNVFRLGWHRNKELIELSGLRINDNIITDATRAIIRYVIRASGSTTGHQIARDFIKEATSNLAMKMNTNPEADQNEIEEAIENKDKEFFENTIFSSPQMNDYIHKQCSTLLKRIEAINLIYTFILEQQKLRSQESKPQTAMEDNQKTEAENFVQDDKSQSAGNTAQNEDTEKIAEDELNETLDMKDLHNFDLGANFNQNQTFKRVTRTTTLLTDWWHESFDNLLAIATIIYGFGNYDYISESQNENAVTQFDFMSIFGQDEDDKLSYKTLNDRFISIGESLKRSKLKEAEEIQAQIPVETENDSIPSDYKRNEELEKQFSKEDYSNIVRYLMKLGIDVNMETGEKNYESFARNAGLLNNSQNENDQDADNEISKRIDNIRLYVEDLLIRCRLTPEEGGIPPKVASNLLKRVTAMDQLRSLLYEISKNENKETENNPADTENENNETETDPSIEFFESVTKWRSTPETWTPAHELKFLNELSIQGLTSLSAILSDPFFEVCFPSGNPPQFMTTISSVCRRINMLYDFKHKAPVDVKDQNEPNKHDENPKSEKWKPSITPEMVQSGEYEYPIQISPTAKIYNLGTIVYDRPGFHTERYIYPAGYKCSRLYPSLKNPSEKVTWFAEILDVGEDLPQFRIWMEDDPDLVFTGTTPTAPWTSVAKATKSKKGSNKKSTISGPDSLLFNQHLVIYLIQKLPNAELLTDYQFRSFPNLMKNEPK